MCIWNCWGSFLQTSFALWYSVQTVSKHTIQLNPTAAVTMSRLIPIQRSAKEESFTCQKTDFQHRIITVSKDKIDRLAITGRSTGILCLPPPLTACAFDESDRGLSAPGTKYGYRCITGYTHRLGRQRKREHWVFDESSTLKIEFSWVYATTQNKLSLCSASSVWVSHQPNSANSHA